MTAASLGRRRWLVALALGACVGLVAALGADLYLRQGLEARWSAELDDGWVGVVRTVEHRPSFPNEHRALSRIVFAPIWIALSAVYAAGQTVGPEWTHSFGLGGLFGDMMMGTVLGILPVGAGLGLKLVMLVLGVGIVAMGAFVLGFTKPELGAIGRFLLVGTVMAYDTLLRLLGRGASSTMSAAQRMQASQSERRERRRQEDAEAAAHDHACEELKHRRGTRARSGHADRSGPDR